MLAASESHAKAGVEETRARILAATRELYARNGSRGTTTREVAERAGLNEATLFRHFGTKVQLISAMLDHYSSASQVPEMLARVRALPTLEAQLRELGLEIVESIKRREDLIRVSMAEEMSNPEGNTCTWQAPTAARRLLAEFFEEKVMRGQLTGDPDLLARIFMSLFFAYVMARKIWGDCDVTPERVTTRMVDTFLHGAQRS